MVYIDAKEPAEPPPNRILHPDTGRPIDPEDADGLIDALERVKEIVGKVLTHKEQIEDAIFAHAADLKTKTRRVQGERRKAKIEMPGDSVNGSRLRTIAEEKKFRLIWPQLIRVAQYGVKKRELAKALNTKGTDVWNEYRDAVRNAIGPPSGRPRITIEE